MPSRISPSFPEAKLESPTVEDLIDVLEDRVRNWLIEPARALAQTEIGGIPSLCLLLTYFEGIWIYIRGEDSRGRSRQFFVDAFAEVFSSSGQSAQVVRRVAQILYDDARCGFFHDGMTRGRILVSTLVADAITITVPRRDGTINPDGEIQSLLINPRAFLASVEQHLLRFVARLRDPAQKAERDRFAEICRQKWEYESAPVVIGMADPSA